MEADFHRNTFVWKKAIYKNEGKTYENLLVLLENINLEELKQITFEKETLINDIDKIIN